MKDSTNRAALLLMITAIVLILTSESWGMWHNILNENFNRNPRQNTWPWRTPGDPHYDQDWVDWNHNPLNWPSPPSLPRFTNCSWGLQNDIYNSQVTPDANHQSAIWCAYATQQGPNAPQWPDEDTYWDGMNAWAWWGPFSLEDAESALLTFWYFLDVEEITNDSLSVVIVNDPDYLTSDDLDFRRNCGFGSSFAAPIEDWQMHTIYMESLRVNGQEVSFLGEEEVWIAFVWQSDTLGHLGPGAFIDDVIVSWDDGLFDLRSSKMEYGYMTEDETVYWSSKTPSLYQETQLRLSYKVEGRDDYTPSFEIACYIDDELFYRENVDRRQGDIDTTFYSITDEFWVADSGEHLIRWELDAPAGDGGEIEESNEENNTYYALIEIEWDPAPQFEILTPDTESDYLRMNEAYPISWAVSDSNETDDSFEVFLFASTDTSGFEENHQVIYEDHWRLIAIEASAETGEHISYFTPNEPIDSLGDVIFVAGVATDGNPENSTFNLASGTIELSLSTDPGKSDQLQVEDYKLDQVYPNPFNSNVSIAYSLPVSVNVNLTAYDFTGREVETLVSENKSAGKFVHNWRPRNLPGGVYLIKLDAGGKSFLQKAVYMP